MNISNEQIRGYRLHAHHLDQKLPISSLTAAAGACGIQNSPPGTWETSLFHRIRGCTFPLLQKALYEEKSLVQAWSFRGAPVIFPTAESDIFLNALTAETGEQPWIYTKGISAALEYLQMPFEDLLERTKKAALYLDHHVIKSKETLDQTLAGIIQKELSPKEQLLWRAPSMYGNPDRQTVGEAAVSFLLRPCSFSSLVVFGERHGNSPTFTSFINWTGKPPKKHPDGQRELIRKFLHCYGPSSKDALMRWLGCSPRQASRLWNTVSEEMEPVKTGDKIRYMLSADREALLQSAQPADHLILLGPHDPYLDIKDRDILLSNKALQKQIWKTVGNPGAVLKSGQIIGSWKSKIQKEKIAFTITLFEPLGSMDQNTLKNLAEEYAAFRQLHPSNILIQPSELTS
ncbi:MAG: winged helix DNA-binding domain-containing protein [Blautia sp.]|jgi:hypothetical protein